MKVDKMIDAMDKMCYKETEDDRERAIKMHKAGMSIQQIVDHLALDNMLGVSMYDDVQEIEQYKNILELQQAQGAKVKEVNEALQMRNK